jgi:hypothetical protein
MEKEKSLQADKQRKQVREQNEALVKLEKQLNEKAADKLRQIEKDAREKELEIDEKHQRHMKL